LKIPSVTPKGIAMLIDIRKPINTLFNVRTMFSKPSDEKIVSFIDRNKSGKDGRKIGLTIWK
jgi:hypothetical protein